MWEVGMKKIDKKPKASKISVLKKKVISKIAEKKEKFVSLSRKKRTVIKKTIPATRHVLPLQEMRVEQVKYFTGIPAQVLSQRSSLAELEQRSLPQGYDEDIIVLQIRDPWWAHTYWDVSFKTMDKLRSQHGAGFDKSRWVLRSYDVSLINFDGTNAHRFFDTGIDVDARNWYLNFASPGTSWCVDLGIILPDGRFVTIARSNIISLPLDGPSWVTDEEWMIPDDEFRRLYGLSVGLGPNVTTSVGKLWQERLKKDVTSNGIASMGVSSPIKKGEKKGEFWLVVDCELIVYGATEPDAAVTVQGKSIKLRKDGTFTLRYALPDGKQEIPVVARSAKIDETRTITPIVTRRTTRNP
jgi:uncharacterized protein